MMTALAHRINVSLIFVTADQKRNAMEGLIHAHLDSANVAIMMNF